MTLNELSHERMEGLVRIKDRQNFENAVIDIKEDLEKEGFDPFEIRQYLISIIDEHLS